MLLQQNNNPKREMYCVKYRVCTVLTDAQYTIRYGHVWTECVSVGASGPFVSVFTHCTHDEYEVRKNLQNQRNIAEPQSLFKVQH